MLVMSRWVFRTTHNVDNLNGRSRSDTFAIQWIPFGGGPADEIFIRFGMTPERFRERLHEVIRCHWCRIHPVTRRHLIRVWLSHLTADAWGDQRDD